MCRVVVRVIYSLFHQAHFNRKTFIRVLGFPIVKVRWLWGDLIFNGNVYPGKIASSYWDAAINMLGQEIVPLNDVIFNSKTCLMTWFQVVYWLYFSTLLHLAFLSDSLFIPPATKLGGYIGFTPSVCLSVCPSVCLSVCSLTFRVCPVASTVQDGFFPYLVQMINSMRGCVACDDPWPWPISSRSFSLDFENRVRSVASTILDGFFLYLPQIITIIRGCVACDVFFRIWKFEFLANLKKI